MKTKRYAKIGIIGLLAMMGAAWGEAVPDHFSPKAKELLSNSIPLAPSAHQLNVVYFVGNGSKPVADYERRISELLYHLRQFYGKEMDRNGYGKRSFGLNLKENGNVDILLIQGKRPAAEYSYEGDGARLCMEEINTYFNEHPETKHSRHTFVIIPTLYNERYNDKNPGGVPFFGYGVNCFALDYADFDLSHLGQDTPEGQLLTKWYGGFAHELGHGLNLPHNNGPASLNKMYGTPLMNRGNSTFGRSATYLTPASTAILDRSETFAVQGDAADFYATASPAPQVRDFHMEYDGDTLQISFTCQSNGMHVNAYIQDPPYEINQDYDAVSFRGVLIDEKPGESTISFSIPRKELKSLISNIQQLDFLFIEENGCKSRWSMELKWDEIKPGTVPAPSNFSPSRVNY